MTSRGAGAARRVTMLIAIALCGAGTGCDEFGRRVAQGLATTKARSPARLTSR